MTGFTSPPDREDPGGLARDAYSGGRAQAEQPLSTLGAEDGERLVPPRLGTTDDLGEARVAAERGEPRVIDQRVRDGVTGVDRPG